jgi:hypothetical protein
VSGQFHTSGVLPPGERAPVTSWIGDRVGPRTDLDAAEKKNISPLLPGIKPNFLGISAGSPVNSIFHFVVQKRRPSSSSNRNRNKNTSLYSRGHNTEVIWEYH